MATQTLTTFDALLKNVYRGPITELLNQELYLITWVQKRSVNDLGTFTGRQFIFPAHVGRNRGRGATTDGGALVTAGSQSYLDGIELPKYLNQGIEVSDMVIKQSSTDEGAFTRALESEMSGALTDMRKDASRMAYGTGDGLLATVNSSTSGTAVIQVDSGQYIAVGDTVDVLVKSSGATITNGSAVQVTAVTYNGTANSSTQAQAQVTLSGGNVTVTAAHGVYVSGDRNNESNGLRNICSTGRTLHQINSSTYPIWDSNVKDLGNSNPSEDTIMQLVQTSRQRSGQAPDRALTSLGVQRRLANTYASQKRWNNDSVLEIDGGYSAIMVAAGNKPIPVVADVDATNGHLYTLNQDSFAWAQVAAPDWLEAPDGKGSILHLKDATTAGQKLAIWQAWIVWYAQFICVAPHRNGKMININDDIPVARI